MTGPDPQNITVCNQGTRLFGFGVMVMAIAATLGGMFDPTSGDRLELLPGGFFLAVELVLLVRALRLGVTVTASTVTLRGWFRTRTLDRATVTRGRGHRHRPAGSTTAAPHPGDISCSN